MAISGGIVASPLPSGDLFLLGMRFLRREAASGVPATTIPDSHNAGDFGSFLVGVARRNRVIVDQDTADLLPKDQIETRPLPARPMRGFGVMEPLTARRV